MARAYRAGLPKAAFSITCTHIRKLVRLALHSQRPPCPRLAADPIRIGVPMVPSAPISRGASWSQSPNWRSQRFKRGGGVLGPQARTQVAERPRSGPPARKKSLRHAYFQKKVDGRNQHGNSRPQRRFDDPSREAKPLTSNLYYGRWYSVVLCTPTVWLRIKQVRRDRSIRRRQDQEELFLMQRLRLWTRECSVQPGLYRKSKAAKVVGEEYNRWTPVMDRNQQQGSSSQSVRDPARPPARLQHVTLTKHIRQPVYPALIGNNWR